MFNYIAVIGEKSGAFGSGENWFTNNNVLENAWLKHACKTYNLR